MKTSPRPSVLLVGLSRLHERRFVARLREAGYDVVCTRSRAAAIVYGNELEPDFVLTDATTARLLRGCYPDGPFWVRDRFTDDEPLHRILELADIDLVALRHMASCGIAGRGAGATLPVEALRPPSARSNKRRSRRRVSRPGKPLDGASRSKAAPQKVKAELCSVAR